ncbi:hypothetical protein I4U23_024223 [Adineta vaga]|nr:hypothetical protein I4U23_024223 [Adineta vaga]
MSYCFVRHTHIHIGVNKYQRRSSFIIGRMPSFSSIFLLILYFTYSHSTDTNKPSSEFSYQSDQRLLAYNQDTDRFEQTNSTNKNSSLSTEKSRQQTAREHLKILLIIGGVSIGMMTVFVIALIVSRVFCTKQTQDSETIEQTIVLQRPKQMKHQTVPQKRKAMAML